MATPPLIDENFARRPLGMRLAMLIRLWRAAIDEAVAFTGLTQASWTVLMQLQQLGDNTPVSELAHAQGIELPPLTRTLTGLEQRGFISRQALAGDRRVKLLSLTPAGREVLDAVSLQIDACQHRITGDIASDDIEHFSQTVNMLAANLQNLK